MKKLFALCLALALTLCSLAALADAWNPNAGVSQEFLDSLGKQDSQTSGHKEKTEAPEYKMKQKGNTGSGAVSGGSGSSSGAKSQTSSVYFTSVTKNANGDYVVTYAYEYYGSNGGEIWCFSDASAYTDIPTDGLKSGDKGTFTATIPGSRFSESALSIELELRNGRDNALLSGDSRPVIK